MDFQSMNWFVASVINRLTNDKRLGPNSANSLLNRRWLTSTFYSLPQWETKCRNKYLVSLKTLIHIVPGS